MIDNKLAGCFVVGPTCCTGGCSYRITHVGYDSVVLIGSGYQSGLDLGKCTVDERLDGSGKCCRSRIGTVLRLIQLDRIAKDPERRFCARVTSITRSIEHARSRYSCQDSDNQYDHYKLYQAKG